MSDMNLNLPASAVKASDSISVSAPTSPSKNSRQLPSKQTMSSTSATGNPRNKTALKPGHSLIDWIRLGCSGRDLAGTRGVITPVSHAELAKHNKIDDAWLAIRGKVYNVTHYFNFHPGGTEELMRGVGRDATKIFDEVHAWVNYEQLLAKCLVGPLQNTVTLTFDPTKPTGGTASLKSSPTHSSVKSLKFKSPFSLTPPPKITADDNPTPCDGDMGEPTTPPNPEVVPRFDWIQKTTNITIIFYTKPFCDPGLIVEAADHRAADISVRLLIERSTHLCKFQFFHDVRWPPCLVKVANETGKVELTFTKIEPQLWTNYGSLERRKITELEMLQFDYSIAVQQPINHDSNALVLEPRGKYLIRTPLGHHLSLAARLENYGDVTRSYTPVPVGYLPLAEAASTSPYSISLLVKSYEFGLLSKTITRPLPMGVTLTVSPPKGDFTLAKLRNHSRIALLAAGSGITPMLGLIDYLLFRSSNKVENLRLYCFNKTLQDAWCRDRLDSMEVKDDRLQIKHILSQQKDDWNGDTGRVSLELIKRLADLKSPSYVTFACMCGPREFNDTCLKLFSETDFERKHLYCFQG